MRRFIRCWTGSLVMIENAGGRRRLVEMDIASRQRRVLSRADENVLEAAAGAADETQGPGDQR